MVPQKWTEKNIDVDRSALPSLFHLRLTDHKLGQTGGCPSLVEQRAIFSLPDYRPTFASYSFTVDCNKITFNEIKHRAHMGSRVPFTVLFHLQQMANTMSEKHV